MFSEDNIQHGRAWRGENVAGWAASEKLDGCRGYWDGQRMWSRSGRVITLPERWRRSLPPIHLDGEIFAGRGGFELTVQAVARNDWVQEVCFIVFDAPGMPGTWPERIEAARQRVRTDFAATVPWQYVTDLNEVAQIFRAIRLGGGEGLVLRNPEVVGYRRRRVATVLKLKKCPLTGELAWPERRREEWGRARG